RSEAVAMAVLDAFVAKQKETSAKPAEAKKPATLRSTVEGTPRLSTEPTLVPLEKTEYKQLLPKLHYRLGELQRDPRLAKRGLVVAFEGPDASGKGGAIRRVTRGLDARFYRVVPIAAPTELEKAHPYLWRFWEMIPPRGKMTFFDRSWYGRVLVERVEGFATEAEWERAYDEIVGFERELCDAGYVVAKFWLHTSKEEQLARFEARQGNRYKNYKLTDDDLRNRKKWDDYQLAASDMITRTDSKHAPWHVIAGDDKQHARIAVLEAIIAALERAID
ncbi:polyphosphate:AMP phosphotransferase, partial [bacterium]